MTTPADDELWSAIADPSRRRIIDLLVDHGAASASWLAGRVPFSRQAVAKHLLVLERAGLVGHRKQGREVLYRIDAERLDQATRAMAGLAVQWDRRLATIKQLAEAAHSRTKGGRGTAPGGSDADHDVPGTPADAEGEVAGRPADAGETR